MAQQDWEAWKPPWNWAVRAENSSGPIIPASNCPNTKHLLMMLIVDNILCYVVGLLYEAWGIYRLWKNIQNPDKPSGLFSRIKKTFLGLSLP
jgi:hypothetical protein